MLPQYLRRGNLQDAASFHNKGSLGDHQSNLTQRIETYKTNQQPTLQRQNSARDVSKVVQLPNLISTITTDAEQVFVNSDVIIAGGLHYH